MSGETALSVHEWPSLRLILVSSTARRATNLTGSPCALAPSTLATMAPAASPSGRDARARISSQFFRAAGDCAPYGRSDSCVLAGTNAATSLTTHRATSMRVSPFDSLEFMLPEASSTRADRAPVLQLCTLLWAGGAFAREGDGRDG